MRLPTRPVLAFCLTLFAVSALACGVSGPTERPVGTSPKAGSQKTGSQKPGGIEVLLNEFRRDTTAASEKWTGKSVLAIGVVDSAEQSDPKSKGPHVILRPGPNRRDIVAAFFTGRHNAGALALKPGETAKIRGTVLNGFRSEDGGAHLTLDDCELVK